MKHWNTFRCWIIKLLTLDRVCSWHNGVMWRAPFKRGTTHGICKRCKRKLLAMGELNQ